MVQTIDRVQLIESLIEHLTQNEDSFINACEQFLGVDVTISRNDHEVCFTSDNDYQEPNYEILHGEIFYG